MEIRNATHWDHRPTPVPDPSTGWTYDRDDLAEVFGTDR